MGRKLEIPKDNEVFGMLTFVKMVANIKSVGKAALWKCQCGNECIMPISVGGVYRIAFKSQKKRTAVSTITL